ncbi:MULTISPECIES: Hpt domain-containing protein [Cupriavidus]|uniref:Hpt domain-containing protein n=1 Tax=Cupriavidus TaxID=106589 RepID=UPI0003AA3C28|nr:MULTISPECIES: Hpt domain-containing protein [Cupriavidus]
MHRALLIGDTTDWAEDSGLATLMEGLGFQATAHALSSPGPLGEGWRLVVVRLPADGALPAGVAPDPDGAGPTLWLAVSAGPADPRFGGTLAEPVREHELVRQLVRHRLMPISAEEEAAFWPAIETLSDGDPDMIAELVRSLVDTNRDDLVLLRDACVASRWDEAASLAHRFKGSARILESRAVVSLCARLEAAARRRDADGVLALLALFEPAIEHMNDCLAER